ncbi:hypothetical protein [Sphingobium sp. S6]|uniref:hypothetical protein n=1 Tax=Sphingobium sp. S6 TaxID=2758386 RepID=UPI001F3D8D74|nr:hypothetical protein [Sphingobium sp. S6]
MIFLHEDGDIARIQQAFLQRLQHALFVQVVSDRAIVRAVGSVAPGAACPDTITDDVPWSATASAPTYA